MWIAQTVVVSVTIHKITAIISYREEESDTRPQRETEERTKSFPGSSAASKGTRKEKHLLVGYDDDDSGLQSNYNKRTPSSGPTLDRELNKNRHNTSKDPSLNSISRQGKRSSSSESANLDNFEPQLLSKSLSQPRRSMASHRVPKP